VGTFFGDSISAIQAILEANQIYPQCTADGALTTGRTIVIFLGELVRRITPVIVNVPCAPVVVVVLTWVRRAG
jgi:hypothetical protein